MLRIRWKSNLVFEHLKISSLVYLRTFAVYCHKNRNFLLCLFVCLLNFELLYWCGKKFKYLIHLISFIAGDSQKICDIINSNWHCSILKFNTNEFSYYSKDADNEVIRIVAGLLFLSTFPFVSFFCQKDQFQCSIFFYSGPNYQNCLLSTRNYRC